MSKTGHRLKGPTEKSLLSLPVGFVPPFLLLWPLLPTFSELPLTPVSAPFLKSPLQNLEPLWLLEATIFPADNKRKVIAALPTRTFGTHCQVENIPVEAALTSPSPRRLVDRGTGLTWLPSVNIAANAAWVSC